jgi:hypothetical protein
MLKDGDEMTIEIERIGRLTNRCREVRPAWNPVSGPGARHD